MTFALLLISSNARDLAAPPDFSAALPLLLLVWAAVTFAPLAVANLRRARRIAVLEIASILELVARSESDPGEQWAISGIKRVLGGDLFGAEEEDRLDLRIERTEVAPIRLRLNGRVVVAEAGVGRSVSKNGLRELRLSGWFVNELSETEVELSREWGLSDTTYADIADALAGVVERLGFSLSGIRLSQVDAGAVPTGGISELILEPLEAETRSS
ncbi:MAG: hypothetical protein JNL42_10000, partial [Anaerolineae bacterium]|nr:hypothetical protein [Anaerolineae bacterium]